MNNTNDLSKIAFNSIVSEYQNNLFEKVKGKNYIIFDYIDRAYYNWGFIMHKITKTVEK